MSDQAQNPVVVLETGAGDIKVEFFTDKAPKHVENFVKLAREGFYDGTRFHRVLPGFMIQGGDPNTKTDSAHLWGTGGPGYTVDAEFNEVHHERGILSMARSADPNSAGSQFFIVHGEAGFLDRNYTVFGRVSDGLEVLDAIANAPRHPAKGAQDEASRPVDPIEIKRATVTAPE